MKIKTEELKKALSVVKPGLASKEIIEQTTSFAFINGKVISYNDEICISYSLDLDGLSGAVKAEEIYNFLKKVKTEEIEVTLSDNDEIAMKSGRANVGFTLAGKIILPLDEEISHIGEWKKLPNKFIDAIKFNAECASDDMSSPKLTCVHFNKEGFIEAADNFRISRWSLNKKLPFKSTLIPATSIKEVIKITPTKVAEGNGWIHFKNEEGTIISCRTFDEEYVNIDSVLKRNPKESFSFTFPDSSVEVLDRASVFTKVQSKQINEEVLDVIIKNNVLYIECRTETAWFKESIPVKKYKGEDFMFRITPYLLQDILKGGKTCTIYEEMLKFETEDWVYISSLRGKVE